jgi:hypothetical protein
MARNALEAVFGALGGGLVGYGKDKTARMDREEERLARELAARQSAEQRRIALFNAGLEEAAPLRERASNLGTASSAVDAVAGMPPVGGMPVGMSAVANALSSASSGMQSDLSRGRSLTVDGRDYVQPYSRTPEGREERATQTQRDRDKLLAQQVRERDAARAKAEEETARAKTARTGLTPKDRAYASTLQFAKTPTSIDTVTGERTFPGEQEVADFAQQAMAAAGQIYENAPRPPRGLTKPAHASQEDWDQYLRETGQTP